MKTEKNVEKHLRLWLLAGNTITHNEAQKKWGTNRLAEFIRRLRHDRGKQSLKIEMTMVSENGDTYGVYKWIPDEKPKSKVKTILVTQDREYRLR